MKKVSTREPVKGSSGGKVTPEEIALHDSARDAWICIRGHVYDVTEYVGFHPGGVERIMAGVGLPDATRLFDEVHPWVNYDKLLTKYYVGRLGVDSVSAVPEVGNVRFESQQSFEQLTMAETPRAPEMRRATIVEDRQREVTFTWLQRGDLLMLTFATGAYSNPYFEIRHPPFEPRWFFVITFVESVFTFQYTPRERLLAPARFKVFHETGKIEVGFAKKAKSIWPDVGDMRQYRRKVIAAQHEKKKYVIVEHATLNKHNFMIALEKADMSVCNTPLGYHVYLYNDINQGREFTPVPHLFMRRHDHSHAEPFTSPLLTFVIRRYPDGRVGNYLYNKKVGDVVLGTEPVGIFDLHLISGHNYFYMLAGGIGITPYLALIVFLLERKDPPVNAVFLLHFNPTGQHEVLGEKLAAIADEDPRFNFLPVLTQPPPDYAGPSGHVTPALLRATMTDYFRGVRLDDIFFLSCGPTVFNNGCYEQLTQLRVRIECTYYFSSAGVGPGKGGKKDEAAAAAILQMKEPSSMDSDTSSTSLASREVEEAARPDSWERPTRRRRKNKGYACPCPPCFLSLRRAWLGTFGSKKRNV